MLTNSTKNKGIDDITEIFIDGKSKSKGISTNPDDIATMDVIKTITNPRYNYYEGKTTGVRSIF
jgi:hypothetical protein